MFEQQHPDWVHGFMVLMDPERFKNYHEVWYTWTIYNNPVDYSFPEDAVSKGTTSVHCRNDVNFDDILTDWNKNWRSSFSSPHIVKIEYVRANPPFAQVENSNGKE